MAPPAPGGRTVVTIADVAIAAGVSRSTVSRAFGRPDLIKPETVQRILAIALRMGYVGNQAARALSTGRFGNIAVVVPDIANPFFPPLLRAVQSAAEAAGYAVFLGDSDESAEREHRLLTRLSSQVDGCVVASSRMTTEQIREHQQRRPLVLINREIAEIATVQVDSAGGMIEAVRHLTQHGHKRIVYLSGPSHSWSDRQRRDQLSTASAHGVLSVQTIEVGRPSWAAGRDAVSAVLSCHVTAAIAFDDVVAQGLMAGLALRGIRVPADFSVIGCDDILAATTSPPLTTISAGSAAAGRVAVELLTQIIENPEPALHAQHITLPTHLVIRASSDRASPLPD